MYILFANDFHNVQRFHGNFTQLQRANCFLLPRPRFHCVSNGFGFLSANFPYICIGQASQCEKGTYSLTRFVGEENLKF